MALNRVEWHIQHACYLTRIEVLLVSQDHTQSGFVRKRVHHSSQHVRKEHVVLGRIRRWFGNVFDADLGPHFKTSRLIDTSMAGDLAQPEYEMLGRLDGVEVLMQVQEDFLRQ